MSKIWLILFIGLGVLTNCLGQQAVPNMDIGLYMEGVAYQGDMYYHAYLPQQVGLGYGATARFSGRGRLSHQVQLGISNVSAQTTDFRGIAYSQIEEPFAYFHSRIYQAVYQLQWTAGPHWLCSPYLKAGAGLSRFTPFDENNNNLFSNIYSRIEGEQVRNLSYFLPMSAGVQWRLGAKAFLLTDFTYHYWGTDYLDNIGKAGSQAGKDLTQSLRISFLYRIGGEPIVFAPPIAQTPPPEAAQTKPQKELNPRPPKAHKSKPQKSETPAKLHTSKPEKIEDWVEVGSKTVLYKTPILTLSPNPLPVDDFREERLNELRKAIVAKQFVEYVVLPGDKWKTISNQFHVPVEYLKSLNNMQDNSPPAGVRLLIPNVK